ncbi:recombination protein RecR [Leuconostoc pseudomesenteroides]|uniref:Recombination protein RecR n=1 Tax=Leuconostoc pseudomesenteroides TaxID=33968 RepID=A0A1X0VEH7_LEUPS|nr:recombination mediator RecR [Leuconostoc pseudomesenteroides]OQJ73282.1 recombination protein RecR [Leuconostoc pseudomesenteroides]OQJ76560.1 recombination protein RecR [Leuconostoc pseudomesenteroides]OQJ77484.1 recombination protein RecR [Leuconostoc pseudomesenteroides]ORI37675.1 recombination protein RecR [Leuconostoc pseudomesenteroides]ORI46062.1 recombination protein RecR [Leuconostoc pseudomesenteroides]
MQYPEPIAKLIDSYAKLPGVGVKTATRLAFYTLGMSESDVTDFSKSLLSAKNDLTFCMVCGNITEKDINPCVICRDESRDQSTVFVVENSRDVMAMENTRDYHGLYHVLNGVISPSAGTGPEDINLPSLIRRLSEHEEIKEVIVGTNANAEGEATAMYLARLLKPAGLTVTRLAHGLAVGSDIDYADELTLIKAVQGRTKL